jgi:periplasmic copper chaperone A
MTVPTVRAEPQKRLPDMTRALLTRAAAVAAGVAVATLALTDPASAHVTVHPGTAAQDGYTTVAFQVPNETDSTDTTKVEVDLPTDTPIASVSVKPLTGWTTATEKAKLATPVTTDDGQVTEAVRKITWTAAAGSAIRPGQFQEFEVALGPLPKANEIVFKALQTYSDGSVARWIDEPTTDGTEPEHPAPVLKLTAAGAAAPSAPAAAPTVSVKGDGNGTPYGVAAIVLALAALLLGLLAYRRAARAASAASGAVPARTTPAGPASAASGADPAGTTPAGPASAASGADPAGTTPARSAGQAG